MNNRKHIYKERVSILKYNSVVLKFLLIIILFAFGVSSGITGKGRGKFETIKCPHTSSDSSVECDEDKPDVIP